VVKNLPLFNPKGEKERNDRVNLEWNKATPGLTPSPWPQAKPPGKYREGVPKAVYLPGIQLGPVKAANVKAGLFKVKK